MRLTYTQRPRERGQITDLRAAIDDAHLRMVFYLYIEMLEVCRSASDTRYQYELPHFEVSLASPARASIGKTEFERTTPAVAT